MYKAESEFGQHQSQKSDIRFIQKVVQQRNQGFSVLPLRKSNLRYFKSKLEANFARVLHLSQLVLEITAMSFIASILNQRDARRYSLPSDSDETEKSFESSPFLSPTSQSRTYSIPTWRLVIPWIFSTVAFAFLSLFFYLQSSAPRLGTSETGWRTDFRECHHIFAYQLLKTFPEPARSIISIEQVLFTGSPAYDSDLNYFVPHPGPITYIGEPSPAIDRAWDELTWGKYL